MMSFEIVRKNINSAYTDNFLDSLLEHYPNKLRRAQLKGNKAGIARIVETDVDDEA